MDDTFYDHPKTIRVTLAALGLHLLALSYCGRHLTDGVVPRDWIGRRRSQAEQLVKHNLWERRADGDYQIHHFTQWNPSAAKVKRERSAARVRMNTLRRSGEVRQNKTRSSPSPSRPVPKINPPTPLTPTNGLTNITPEQRTKVQNWIKTIARAPQDQRDQRTDEAVCTLAVDLGYLPTAIVRQIMDREAEAMRA